MRFVDIPSLEQIRLLGAQRAEASVSLFLRTTPVTTNVEPCRIEMRNLIKQALGQLEAAGTARPKISALEELVQDLAGDDEFWKFQSESLIVFATPDSIQSFRLPNHLASGVEVSDRFHIAPLVRAVSFPYLGYVLAMSQQKVSLIEITANSAIDVSADAAIPQELSSALGRTLPRAPAPVGRLQGAEGQKVLVGQFARQIDSAVRNYLHGRNLPLIAAAVQHVAAIYRAHNSSPFLISETLTGNFDHASPAELASAARPLLQAEYDRQAVGHAAEFARKQSSGNTLQDLADVARAATQGNVRQLWIDVESNESGLMDDAGGISFSAAPDASNYDLLGEIAFRVLQAGGEVVGQRRAQMPVDSPVAAVLRYSPMQ